MRPTSCSPHGTLVIAKRLYSYVLLTFNTASVDDNDKYFRRNCPCLRVACGRVGFEGCRVLPAIYAVHSSRLSHPLFCNLLLEGKTPVLTRRRSHAFSGMRYPPRRVNLEPVNRDLKVSFICATCVLIGSYAIVLFRGELQGAWSQIPTCSCVRH